MSFWEILVMALALSADAFSIGAVIGLRFSSKRQMFRLSFHFGLFQFLLSGIGILSGVLLASHIAKWDHWLIFGLLTLIGAKMIHEALGSGDGRTKAALADPTRGWSLVGLSVAVSLDALGAGIGLGLANAPHVLAIIVIGLVSLIATFFAMSMASHIRRLIGHHAEWIGGVVLILLGLKVLLEHLGLISF